MWQWSGGGVASLPGIRALQWARKPSVIFLVALTARLRFLENYLHAHTLRSVCDTGFEACYVAASLAAGRGFSSPFGITTGPTAWIPPAYPGLLGFLFKLCGTYSAGALSCALVLNALLGAATAVGISSVGKKTFGGGAVAAWLWSLSPLAVTMSVKMWESSLSALLAVAGSLFYWRLQAAKRAGAWAGWGFFCGCTALVNPALTVFLLALCFGAVARAPRRGLRLGVAALAFMAVVAPWILRNYVQLGSFIPVRDNFGEELWLGNHPGVTGPNDETRHPLADRAELLSYRGLGEREYLAGKKGEALNFIRGHPAEFSGLTVRRIAYFWSSPIPSAWPAVSVLSFVGLMFGVKRIGLRALPFAAGLLLYPVPYYITHADAWYRHPIEPLMMLLAVCAISEAAGLALRRWCGEDAT